MAETTYSRKTATSITAALYRSVRRPLVDKRRRASPSRGRGTRMIHSRRPGPPLASGLHTRRSLSSGGVTGAGGCCLSSKASKGRAPTSAVPAPRSPAPPRKECFRRTLRYRCTRGSPWNRRERAPWRGAGRVRRERGGWKMETPRRQHCIPRV